ncbi:MAG: putative zinc-binding peptidase [Caldilineaceae bacterium]
MRLFTCHHCQHLVYFENTYCEHCGLALGYLSGQNEMLALLPAEATDGWYSTDRPEQLLQYCANADYQACNWLVPADSRQPDDVQATFCLACQLNRTIPNLSEPLHLEQWRKIEMAKHRLVYSLLRFKLPLQRKVTEGDNGLAFDFLASQASANGAEQPVVTGHAHGIITLDIAEADDAERERQRHKLAEPYRTLLGHFRHEIGHYYWDLFAQDDDWRTKFRRTFGDEQQDYDQALNLYYANGPRTDWHEAFVTAYASMHPWEDWAESWAHYFHIVDTLETAYAFGLAVDPQIRSKDNLTQEVDFDAYRQYDFDKLIQTWLPVTFAVNSLNRSMGQPDLYPFVFAEATLAKLHFVHQTIHQETVSQ